MHHDFHDVLCECEVFEGPPSLPGFSDRAFSRVRIAQLPAEALEKGLSPGARCIMTFMMYCANVSF